MKLTNENTTLTSSRIEYRELMPLKWRRQADRWARAGVYVLHFRELGSVYVGGSFRMEARVDRHVAKLVAGKHPNRRLQAAWDRCGGRCDVKLRPLPVETPEELAAVERVLIREQISRRGRGLVLNGSQEPKGADYGK